MDYIETLLSLDPQAYTGDEQLLIVTLQELCKAYIDGTLEEMLNVD